MSICRLHSFLSFFFYFSSIRSFIPTTFPIYHSVYVQIDSITSFTVPFPDDVWIVWCFLWKIVHIYGTLIRVYPPLSFLQLSFKISVKNIAHNFFAHLIPKMQPIAAVCRTWNRWNESKVKKREKKSCAFESITQL